MLGAIDLADEMFNFEKNMQHLAFLGESISAKVESEKDIDEVRNSVSQLESLINSMAYIAIVHHHMQEQRKHPA